MPDLELPREPAPFSPNPAYSSIYPLDDFYAARGLPLPAITVMDAREVPEPYQTLLAHNNDMTSTLEKFHKAKIHIQPLARRVFGNEYFREVVLALDTSNQPVEFGAIKIALDLFPEEARREIIKEGKPLGKILTGLGVFFSSRPSAWLRVASDPFIGEALQLRGPHVLYGRRNTLLDRQERSLAEIVEILPP